ncbi:MAG: ArsR/SmtB family transcription factor [Bacteroidia bacterium]
MKASEGTVIKIAHIIKVIGHPVRLEILRVLSLGKFSVGEIHEKLGISQPEASKHLTTMKNLSILLSEKKERYTYYRINGEYSFIQAIVNFIKKQNE